MAKKENMSKLGNIKSSLAFQWTLSKYEVFETIVTVVAFSRPS